MRCAPVAAVCSITIVLGACSPGEQDQPDAIDRRDVPFELLDSTTTSAPPASTPAASVSDVYFVLDGSLVPLEREIARTPSALLEALLEGPTAEEAGLGITSAVPSGTTIADLAIDDGTLTVSLETNPGTAESNATLAIGQLVATATGLPGVERVRFRVGGNPVQVPKGDGTLVNRPVGLEDYQELVR